MTSLRMLSSLLAMMAMCVGSVGVAGAEIRQFAATLNQAQETPPTGSAATGFGTFTMDTNANTLTIHVEFSALGSPESAAHIHGFCGPGTPCGILHPLPLGSPKDDVWNFTESDQPNIIAGSTYVNVHSNSFPSGEIRGQITEVVPAVPTTSRRGAMLLAILLIGSGSAFLLRRRRGTARA